MQMESGIEASLARLPRGGEGDAPAAEEEAQNGRGDAPSEQVPDHITNREAVLRALRQELVGPCPQRHRATPDCFQNQSGVAPFRPPRWGRENGYPW